VAVAVLVHRNFSSLIQILGVRQVLPDHCCLTVAALDCGADG